MNLQSLAKSRREGILTTPTPNNNPNSLDLLKVKNNMLNAVKNEEDIEIFENEPIVIKKKHFAEKKYARCEKEISQKYDYKFLKVF